MSWFVAIFLGFVQGVTEFVPVSSSGHLAIFQNLGMVNIHERHLFFDVLLHMGTLVAIYIVYRKDIHEMIRAVIAMIVPAKKGDAPVERLKGRLAFMLLIATAPLVLIIPFRNLIEALGHQIWFVGIMLLVTGGILYFSDKLAKGKRDEKSMTVKNAVAIGLFQCIATIPGISRSGTTITGGLMAGFDRGFAVRFSFLLSIPAILGANIVVLFSSLGDVDWSLLPRYLVGVVVATVTGYFAIRLVKLLVDAGKFGKFAYYCWGAGAFAIILSIVLAFF